MTFEASDAGTPASAWRGYRTAATALDTGALRRLVVLAAHPDDETLAAGGLIAVAARAGRPVVVLVATRGDASHPRSGTWTPDALAAAREQEVREAVAALAPAAEVVLLGLPDGRLAEHADPLREAVAGVVRAGDTVVSTWRRDGHPDHEALGSVAAAVTAEVAATLLEAPIWAWHWGTPSSAAEWPAAVRVELDAETRAAKAAAVATHGTQVAALSDAPGDEVLLTPALLAHFAGDDELFFVTPPARVAEVDFDAMYAVSDDPWGFAERWYERRKRLLTVMSLPAERYGRVLEIGCSTGLLAEELARRADELLATDVAPRAVELARIRLAAQPHARVELRRLPEEWPGGRFDLVVLSETGFYLGGDRLPALAGRIRDALNPAGLVLLCHWRPLVVGLDRGGDAVHAVVRGVLGATTVVRHEEDDFLLEVLQIDPATSVARATGLR